MQTGTLQEVANELMKYNLNITAIQEVRWKGSGIIKSRTSASTIQALKINRGNVEGDLEWIDKHKRVL